MKDESTFTQMNVIDNNNTHEEMFVIFPLHEILFWITVIATFSFVNK